MGWDDGFGTGWEATGESGMGPVVPDTKLSKMLVLLVYKLYMVKQTILKLALVSVKRPTEHTLAKEVAQIGGQITLSDHTNYFGPI